MPRMDRIGKTATSIIEHEDNSISVRYHDTDVVRFDDNIIILDTGGHRTMTTKVRMNQASNVYDLGYQVYQENHKWYINYMGQTIRFDTNSYVLGR